MDSSSKTNLKKNHNRFPKLIMYVLLIIISSIPMLLNVYKTNEAKKGLSFNQSDILKISVNDAKWTITEDYKIFPQIIKKINTELSNNEKKVVRNVTLNIPDNKVDLNFYLDELIEFKNQNGFPYKTHKRQISIIPKDDENVYVSICIKDVNDSKKYITELFSIKSIWLSQYLVDVSSELKSKK